MREYLVGCIASNEDLVKLGYHKNEEFINDVIAEYKTNLKYVEEEYSEIDAKDDAIKTVTDRWAKHTMDKDKVKFIHNSLREARTFSKEVRQYLYEIEKERPLTETEKKLWDKTHDIHVHTNDSGMLIQEEYDDIF